MVWAVLSVPLLLLAWSLPPAEAQPLLGDMDCDQRVDNFDINPFVLALSDPAAYQAVYPSCDIQDGDVNFDGMVNFDDIWPFCLLLAPSQVDPGCGIAPSFTRGDSSLRVFFSQTDQTAGTPQELLNQQNATLDTSAGPARAYLWAQVGGPDDQYWNGLDIGVHATGAAQITAVTLLNPTYQNQHRWDYVHANPPLPTHFGAVNMIAVIQYGVQKPVVLDGYVDAASNSVLLGWLEFTGQGDVYLAVADLGITCGYGYCWYNTVYFGFGDDPVHGSEFGACTALPDLTCTGASPTGACCLTDASCQVLSETSCVQSAGLYLGDDTPCGACAADGDLDHGETVTLNPGGGSGDPTLDALVTITNVSGPDNATVTAGEIADDPHPGAGGFGALGRTVRIDTSLADGQFFMAVQIPFGQSDLPANADPLSIDLTHYDPNSGNWVLGVAGNTQNSPGHSGSVGDRSAVSDVSPPALSTDLGDYGVYWNPGTLRGFAWANVDHATDFAPGRAPVHPGDLNCDGVIDFDDINPFVLALSDPAGYRATYPTCNILNADCNGDGVVDFDDINAFVELLSRD